MELATGTDTRTGWQTQLLNMEAFEAYWPHIEPMLKKVPHTWEEYTIEAFYDHITNGYIQVWAIGPSDSVQYVVFTKVAIFPAMRVLQAIWMCGNDDLDKALEVMDATISEFARVQECARIDIFGRPGWEKHAKVRGFKRSSVVLSRPVVPFQRNN